MITLNADELAGLEGITTGSYAAELARYFTEETPDVRAQFHSDETWERHVGSMAEIAIADGLKEEREVRAHVAISLTRGPEFWQRSAVQEVARRPHLTTPTQRLLAILSRLKRDPSW